MNLQSACVQSSSFNTPNPQEGASSDPCYIYIYTHTHTSIYIGAGIEDPGAFGQMGPFENPGACYAGPRKKMLAGT